MRNHFFNERSHIGFPCVGQLPCFHGSSLCNGKNRTLFRLHYRFISGFHRFFSCGGKNGNGNFFIFPDPFGKSAEKLGKDNTRIPSRTAEGTGRNCLCKSHHVGFFHSSHFFGGRHDGKGHIGTRISVRNRKYVQFINPFFFTLKILGAR